MALQKAQGRANLYFVSLNYMYGLIQVLYNSSFRIKIMLYRLSASVTLCLLIYYLANFLAWLIITNIQ